MAEENTTNNIPAWVDPDYGYDPANPRKPNMREMMELIAGKSVEEIYASGEDYSDISSMASSLIYGVVGSNTDTRDFVAITNAATDTTTGQIDADKFVAATQIATSQMYGGTTVKAYQAGGNIKQMKQVILLWEQMVNLYHYSLLYTLLVMELF